MLIRKSLGKTVIFTNCTAKALQKKVIENGNRILEQQPIREIREYVAKQLEYEIWQEEQRFENPHKHYLDMTPEYYELKWVYYMIQ